VPVFRDCDGQESETPMTPKSSDYGCVFRTVSAPARAAAIAAAVPDGPRPATSTEQQQIALAASKGRSKASG
jgi:hypothetical protein